MPFIKPNIIITEVPSAWWSMATCLVRLRETFSIWPHTILASHHLPHQEIRLVFAVCKGWSCIAESGSICPCETKATSKGACASCAPGVAGVRPEHHQQGHGKGADGKGLVQHSHCVMSRPVWSASWHCYSVVHPNQYCDRCAVSLEKIASSV